MENIFNIWLDYVMQSGYCYVSSSQSLAASTSTITMFTRGQHQECPCGQISPTYSITPSSMDQSLLAIK